MMGCGGTLNSIGHPSRPGRPPHMVGRLSVLLGRVRKERDRASPFERRGQRSLMPGTGACHAARQDLAAVADEAAEARDLLVIDVLDLLDAEAADLAVLAL